MIIDLREAEDFSLDTVYSSRVKLLHANVPIADVLFVINHEQYAKLAYTCRTYYKTQIDGLVKDNRLFGLKFKIAYKAASLDSIRRAYEQEYSSSYT